MHRNIQLIVPSEHTEGIVSRLRSMDAVIALAVHANGSVKPPGDLIHIATLNRGADDIMRIVDDVSGRARIIAVTSDVTNISDKENQDAIENDSDDELWEEIETGLRQTTHVTANYIGLMAMGGAVASTALALHGIEQAIAFVAASIIAPGFEPIAKAPIGLVLKSSPVAKRAAVSLAVGYGALMLAAALTFFGLSMADVVDVKAILSNEGVKAVVANGVRQNVLLFCGAIAGLIMLSSYREEVIAGPFLILAIIPASAVLAVGIATANGELARMGAARLAVDVAVVAGTAAAFTWVKQRLVHKRRAML